MADKKGKKSKSKRSGKRSGGKKRSKRSKRSKSSGGFTRVDAAGNRCAGFAGSVSPFGNECFWAQRMPGIPRAYRSLVPPFRAPGQFQLALDAASPVQSYQLRNMGVRGSDARRIAELRALQGGGDQYGQYVFGRALQKGRLGGALPLLAMSGGQIDPMMAMAMGGGRGFDPMMYAMAQGGKIDPMMYAMMRGRK